MDDPSRRRKAKASLTTIALPRDWCGYGAVMTASRQSIRRSHHELNPDAGSGDEIEAIKANKDNKGPQAPDVIDVGLPSALRQGRGSLLPYKVSTWDHPGRAKDATASGTATTTACSPSR